MYVNHTIMQNISEYFIFCNAY